MVRPPLFGAAANDGVRRFALGAVPSDSPYRGDGDSQQPKPNEPRFRLPYLLAVSVTTSYIEGGIEVDDGMRYVMAAFTDPRSVYHEVTDFRSSSSSGCGRLMTALPIRVVYPHHNHSVTAGGVRIRFEPHAQVPQCRAGIRFGGMVYAPIPFEVGPVLSYAHAAPTVGRLTVDDFVANSWRGSGEQSTESTVVEDFELSIRLAVR